MGLFVGNIKTFPIPSEPQTRSSLQEQVLKEKLHPAQILRCQQVPGMSASAGSAASQLCWDLLER